VIQKDVAARRGRMADACDVEPQDATYYCEVGDVSSIGLQRGDAWFFFESSWSCSRMEIASCRTPTICPIVAVVEGEACLLLRRDRLGAGLSWLL
jgi:hypothetical protein